MIQKTRTKEEFMGTKKMDTLWLAFLESETPLEKKFLKVSENVTLLVYQSRWSLVITKSLPEPLLKMSASLQIKMKTLPWLWKDLNF